MELIKQGIDILLNVDEYLSQVISWAGMWTYLLMFFIVFAETGLVVTPLLPGDSLLFALGAFAAKGDLSLWLLMIILFVAAVLGDTVNYAAGNYIGPRVFTDKIRFLNREHLERTHHFFERYGGKTIIIARFVPIVRTFAPFVAGVGSMTYSTFIFYNIIGALLWVPICLLAGFFFGNLPFVKNNFEAVLLGIIAVSLMPAVFEIVREKLKSRQTVAPAPPAIEED
jgi:membrane-associated protein